MAAAYKHVRNEPDLERHKAELTAFLQKFREKSASADESGKGGRRLRRGGAAAKRPTTGRLKYMKMLTEVAQRRRNAVRIAMDDVVEWQRGEDELTQIMERNTMRYVNVFGEIIDDIIATIKSDVEVPIEVEDTADDCFMETRVRLHEKTRDKEALRGFEVSTKAPVGIPAELRRNYDVFLEPRSECPLLKVRSIGSAQVGSLVKVRGIVTRVTEVRPLLRVATYTCDVCGNEIYQCINKKRYAPLVECPSQECQLNRNKRPLQALTRGSKFVKFQEVKLQESPEEVPEGNVPRSIAVYALGDNTRLLSCGDRVQMAGVWLPIPVNSAEGFRSRQRGGLTTSTYMHCMCVEKDKKDYDDILRASANSEAMQVRLAEMHSDTKIYDRLAASIAPEIYGMEDVKKALLLLLVAGVTNNQKQDGMKIRGDINLLLMGDPGVAKSQLLKHVCRIAPRSIYTTGKGSSGVGLTAAVMRDPVTKDAVLEGGALVLADNGICCIDEFDKMDDSDRTSIYEVMEQQSISIAKAGITTTLNARTAIAAAANPAFGRYDLTKRPEVNINLPNALLSRFDLLFVLVDKCDYGKDESLALHIAYVHQHGTHPPLAGGIYEDGDDDEEGADGVKAFKQPFTCDEIRAYISKAKTFSPSIPKDLTPFIVECYVNMRKASGCDAVTGKYDSRKIVGTPRALLSILRICQALARIRFADCVEEKDVREAIRIIKEAKKSSLKDGDELESGRQPADVMSQIYGQIKTYLISREGACNLSALKTTLTTRGYVDADIEECIEEYWKQDVWMRTENGDNLVLVNE